MKTTRSNAASARSAPASEGSPTVSIARSLPELDEIAAEWHEPVTTPGCDLDYYRAVAPWLPGFLRPHVLLVHTHGEPQALVVGRLEESELPVKIGYRRLWSPRRRCLTIGPGAIAGDLSETVCRSVLASLQESLRLGEADLIAFRELPQSSPLFRLARRIRPRWCRDGCPAMDVHWYLSFPDAPEAPVPASNHARGLLRYYTKRLRKRYGDRLRFEVVTSVSELSRLMNDLEAIASKTYQRRLGVGFVDDEATRRMIRHQMERGWFRSFLLYIDDHPRAFWLGYRYGEVYHALMTGFDPDFRADHIGKVLHGWKLEHLRREGGIRRLEFGFGDADYKQHYATDRHEEGTVRLFAPTWNALSLNAARTVLGKTERLLKEIAHRTERLEAIRTRARRRIEAAGSDGDRPATTPPISSASEESR